MPSIFIELRLEFDSRDLVFNSLFCYKLGHVRPGHLEIIIVKTKGFLKYESSPPQRFLKNSGMGCIVVQYSSILVPGILVYM